MNQSLLKMLVRPLARYLAEHPRAMIIGALVYLVMPIDLIPEMFVGPLGYLDDFVVLLLPYLIRAYVRRLPPKPPKNVYDTTAE